MKSICKLFIAFFIIIISMPTTSKADNPPDFWIENIQFRPFLLLTKGGGLVKIDSGYKIKTILRDSTIADLLSISIHLPKIRIKSLSLSRHDTTYCFANKFPASDSLEWKVKDHYNDGSRDTMKLRDSILELEPAFNHNSAMTVIWQLKKGASHISVGSPNL